MKYSNRAQRLCLIVKVKCSIYAGPFLAPCVCSLVAFDVSINAADKDGRAEITQSPAHDAQADAEDGRVAKVEGCLEEARHFGLLEEVVHAVECNISASMQAFQ